MDISRVDSKVIASSVRTFGSGGFFGYIGKFYNRNLGHFQMYVAKRKDLLLITTPKKKIVVNCEDPKRIINFFNSQKSGL